MSRIPLVIIMTIEYTIHVPYTDKIAIYRPTAVARKATPKFWLINYSKERHVAVFALILQISGIEEISKRHVEALSDGSVLKKQRSLTLCRSSQLEKVAMVKETGHQQRVCLQRSPLNEERQQSQVYANQNSDFCTHTHTQQEIVTMGGG